MSRILDETPELLQVVFDDLTKSKRADTGRQGLTAEQVLRCAEFKPSWLELRQTGKCRIRFAQAVVCLKLRKSSVKIANITFSPDKKPGDRFFWTAMT